MYVYASDIKAFTGFGCLFGRLRYIICLRKATRIFYRGRLLVRLQYLFFRYASFYRVGALARELTVHNLLFQLLAGVCERAERSSWTPPSQCHVPTHARLVLGIIHWRLLVVLARALQLRLHMRAVRTQHAHTRAQRTCTFL